ncbi:MAG: DNA gyrase inhibitor YacG [Bauldia litoralis]
MARTRKCPICGSSATRDHDPFCSRRCADHDLANWLHGHYRIPVDDEPVDEYDDGEPAPRLN